VWHTQLFDAGARSFLPSMLTVDPANSRIHVMDGG
jgi:hypothetical protein